MIKECKVLTWNELVMVVEFDGELIQMPSTEKKINVAYVKFENQRYSLVNEDDYKKSLVKFEKKEVKVEENKSDE